MEVVCQKKTVWQKDGNIRLLTIVLSGCFLIGAAYGCKWLNWYTYNNDEAYGFFTAYNSARADVVDASNYGYEAYAEDLKSVGISENDYYMMRNWTLETMTSLPLRNYSRRQMRFPLIKNNKI